MTTSPDPDVTHEDDTGYVDPWGGPPARMWLRCDLPRASKLVLTGLRAVAAMDDGYRYDLRITHPRVEQDPYGLGPVVLICWELPWLTWADAEPWERTPKPPGGRWYPAGLVYVDVPVIRPEPPAV